MKLIDRGYGNSNDFASAKSKALNNEENKKFRYLAMRSYGGTPGRIGGSFNWEIFGADDLMELLNPPGLSKDFSVLSTDDGKWISSKNLAIEYIKTITPEKRDELINEMLAAHLTR